MIRSAGFCRSVILFLLIISSAKCFSNGYQNTPYNPSIVKEKIDHAIAVGLTDTILAKRALDTIILEAEKNNDRLTLFDAYSAKAKILTNCKNNDGALTAANQAIKIAAELKMEAANTKPTRQNPNLLYIILVLSLGLMTFAYREYKLKKRANVNLSLQKSEIETQKHIVDKRNRDITDSLNYAQRIQHAILETSLGLENFFPESFIIFLPKDIVSGDFYWVKSKNDQILFAMADCTGHGVPGAFMSIIGTYGLNNLVNEFDLTNPGEILNEMNDLFKSSFDQTEGAEIFDGMDIGLCLYNPATRELNYAGANLPLHILRENSKPQPTSHIVHNNNRFTLYQVKPNKQPIGYVFEHTNYVTHGIQLMEGDILYLFTDGYADQFGGLYKKKYRYQELRKLICDIALTPLDDQRSILYDSFRFWKADNIQVDDMSFMGIKIA